MIERNLGNLERVLRFLLGCGLLGWAISRPALNGVEWFVLLISSFLIMNGIFSRCYLWYLLDLNSCDPKDPNCSGDPSCR